MQVITVISPVDWIYWFYRRMYVEIADNFETTESAFQLLQKLMINCVRITFYQSQKKRWNICLYQT